jgi:hypothetical protein
VTGSCLGTLLFGKDRRHKPLLVEAARDEWQRGKAAEVTMLVLCIVLQRRGRNELAC